MKELRVEDGVREYDIGGHRVYCHYRREVMHIPEPTGDRVVIFLDRSGLEDQPPKAGAAAIRVRGWDKRRKAWWTRWCTGQCPMERCKRWRMWLGR